jgi:hypothetical protein
MRRKFYIRPAAAAVADPGSAGKGRPMITVKARAVVSLARDMADIIPFPPGGRHPDPVMYRAWEELMLQAASGLALSVGYDREVLDAAVGPKLEVGVNPAWRVLLMIAQQEARARQEARPAACVNQPATAFG